MRSFYYSMPTILINGKGSIDLFLNQIQRLRIDNAYILTGLNSAKENGVLDKVIRLLESCGINYVVDNSCETQPKSEYVNRQAEKLSKSVANIIIAIGGGSVLDAAKGIALMANNYSNTSDIWDYKTHALKFVKEAMPIIAIPTTIGTGSECNGTFALYNSTTSEKFVFFNLSVRPKLAWCHPDHVKSLSVNNLHESVADVLGHLLEQYFTIDEKLIWSDFAILGIIENIISDYNKIEHWEFAIDLRENVQILSSMAMSYLFSQGKSVSWSLHFLADLVAGKLHLKHGESIQLVLKFWLNLIAYDERYFTKLNHISKCIASFEPKINEQKYVLVLKTIKENKSEIHNILSEKIHFDINNVDYIVDSLLQNISK